MQKNKRNGISAKSIEVPTIFVLIILHAVIIALILAISSSTTKLSSVMSASGRYTQEVSSLTAGMGLLSETSNNYVMIEEDAAKTGNIIAYATELKDHPERHGDDLLNRFETYADVSDDAKAKLRDAIGYANAMTDAQLHSIALFGLPNMDNPYLTYLATLLPELTDTERAWDAEKRGEEARKLIVSSEYSRNRRDMSNSVNEVVSIIQRNFSITAGEINRQVKIERTAMWIITFTIIAIIGLGLGIIHYQIIHPLAIIAKKIPTGEDVNQRRGLREVRTVARAYNKEHKRRDALDTILRSAAETDELTGIPNRYCYEQHLLSCEESESSAAVFFFDIDALKLVNDREGHLAGDRLIRSAAKCIVNCFGKDSFRLGGDEFVAIVKDCTYESAEEMLNKFEKVITDEKIGISFGWAYTEKLAGTDIRQLVGVADKKMYERKVESKDKRSDGNSR